MLPEKEDVVVMTVSSALSSVALSPAMRVMGSHSPQAKGPWAHVDEVQSLLCEKSRLLEMLVSIRTIGAAFSQCPRWNSANWAAKPQLSLASLDDCALIGGTILDAPSGTREPHGACVVRTPETSRALSRSLNDALKLVVVSC